MNVELILHNLFRYNVVRSFYQLSAADQEWILNTFRTQYYANATPETHLVYLSSFSTFFCRYQRLPTPSEFFLTIQRICFCEYSVNNESYVRAASFFMRETGDVLNIPCHYFYYHSEFYEIEHRDPTMEEFLPYIRHVEMINSEPDIIFELFSESLPESDGVPPHVIQTLRASIQTLSEKNCGICQEEIVQKPGIPLPCGHAFHSEVEDCCETGTIFTWLETHSSCPICRASLEQKPADS